MKNLQEYLTESSNAQINEGKDIWVIELVPKNQNIPLPGLLKEVCASEKAARVWCIEFNATYPAWKLQYSKGSQRLVTGLWNEQTGDELVIGSCPIYKQEKTSLTNYGI